MKETMIYICEFCKTQYAHLNDAKLCEGSHRVPAKIVECKYRAYKVDKSGCPDVISVAMTDGTVKRYKRVSD